MDLSLPDRGYPDSDGQEKGNAMAVACMEHVLIFQWRFFAMKPVSDFKKIENFTPDERF